MKRPPFRKVAIYGSGILVGLGLLGAAVIALENYRGKRAWENHRREAEARGVKFGLEHFVPASIPDAENFAATPLFARLFEGSKEEREQYADALKKRLALEPAVEGAIRPKGSWQVGKKVDLSAWAAYLNDADLPTALKKYDPELAEISKAAERPGARFPMDYSKGPMSMSYPHLTPLMSAANILRLRSLSSLANGQTGKALADIEVIFRLGEAATQSDAHVITALVQISGVSVGLQPVWEGLAAHQWSEEQLVKLQSCLQRIDLLAMSRGAFERERMGFPVSMGEISENVKLGSGAWVAPFVGPILRPIAYQNMVLADRLMESCLTASIDLEARRVLLRTSVEDIMAKNASRFAPYRMMSESACSLVAMQVHQPRIAAGQTYLDAATIACALERYRLKEGKLPSKLEALAPHYLAKLPHDVITGEPLRYRLTEDGGYLLYSAGVDGIDDGGLIVTKENGSVDPDKGDWVWKMPGALNTPSAATTP